MLSADRPSHAQQATKKLDIPTLGTHPPKVGTMSAGSSSAMGYLISPQMVETNNGVGLRMLTAKLGHMGHLLGTSLKGQRGVPADDEANKAHPGLIKFMGPSLYGHDEDRADYRMIDGCFVDNSGIAFTVATMQKDAIALGTADKSGPKRMRLIGTSYSAKNDDDTVMQVLFANPQHDTTGVSWLAEKFGNPEGNAAFRKWQTSAKDRGIDLGSISRSSRAAGLARPAPTAARWAARPSRRSLPSATPRRSAPTASTRPAGPTWTRAASRGSSEGTVGIRAGPKIRRPAAIGRLSFTRVRRARCTRSFDRIAA